MNNVLLQQLKQWRMQKARQEGVELFRILPNKTLDELAIKIPSSMSEMLEVSGIKEKKFQRYGHELLALISVAQIEDSVTEHDNNKDTSDEMNQEALSVSSFLDVVNNTLSIKLARVQGEVSSVNVQGSYLFFSLKDKIDGSLINCFMWARDYGLCGVKLEEGLEIILNGVPEIYKPTGRFTVRVTTVELVGEGILKKAYDVLKKSLQNDGLFSLESKRSLPEYPHNIGIITSKTGAVIHDFLNNLGKFGYNIQLYNSRVEGQRAVSDMLSGLKYFSNKDIDVLVIVRGGGSLESLQAFNNETIVRNIANFHVPVVCGIGHDKDVPLASLASDKFVSTPTAVSVLLNNSWEKAESAILLSEQQLITKYSEVLTTVEHTLNNSIYSIDKYMTLINNIFRILTQSLKDKLQNIINYAQNNLSQMEKYIQHIISLTDYSIKQKHDRLNNAERVVNNANPMRILKLGYSMSRIDGKIFKSVKNVTKNSVLETILSDGVLESKVINIKNSKNERL